MRGYSALIINLLCVQRRTHSAMDCGPDRLIDPSDDEVTGQYTNAYIHTCKNTS